MVTSSPRGQHPPAPAPIAISPPLPPDSGDGDRLVDTDEAARIAGVTSIWLKNDRKLWKGRKKGYGPPFIRVGPRLVRYSVRAIMAWADANTVGSAART
jgi:hypothetical protein